MALHSRGIAIYLVFKVVPFKLVVAEKAAKERPNRKC